MRKNICAISALLFSIIPTSTYAQWPSNRNQASDQQRVEDKCASLLGEIERRGEDLRARCQNDVMMRSHGTIGVMQYKKDKREFDLLRNRFRSMGCDDYGSGFMLGGVVDEIFFPSQTGC